MGVTSLLVGILAPLHTTQTHSRFALRACVHACACANHANTYSPHRAYLASRPHALPSGCNLVAGGQRQQMQGREVTPSEAGHTQAHGEDGAAPVPRPPRHNPPGLLPIAVSSRAGNHTQGQKHHGIVSTQLTWR